MQLDAAGDGECFGKNACENHTKGNTRGRDGVRWSLSFFNRVARRR